MRAVVAALLTLAATVTVVSTPGASPVEAVDFFKIGYGDAGNTYLINPDGTNSTRFKNISFSFDWTPDGEKFVWRRDSSVAGSPNIFLRNQNGAEFPIGVSGTDAEISNDGTKVVYTSYDRELNSRVIKVVDVNGNELADLGPGRNGTFSPDGTKVAFEKRGERTVSCGDPRTPDPDMLDFGSDGLAVASSTGGASTWIIEPAQTKSGENTDGGVYFFVGGDPDWSPDGTQILVHGFEVTATYDADQGFFGGCTSKPTEPDVYIVGAGGGVPTNLTADAQWIGGSFPADPTDLNASFSPDGKTIAFASSRNVPRDGGIHSLWKMDRSGANQELVLATKRVDSTDWTTALPVGEQVTIKAPDACATEHRTTPGTFVIERSGVTDGSVDITVKVAASSTATSGLDFPAIPTKVTIPNETSLVNLVVFPTDDVEVEGDETITVEIVSADGGLLVGEPSKATITIDDDDDEAIGPCADAAPTAPDVAPLSKPGRFFDTRPGSATVDGADAGQGAVPGGSEVEIAIAGRGEVAGDAEAVVLNLTAINPTGRGFATIHPCGDRPTTASLNYTAAGVVVGNEVVAKLSSKGSVCVYTSATTQLTADVVGYVPAGSATRTLTPARLLDTRPGQPTIDNVAAGDGVVAAGEQIEVQITGRGGVEPGAQSAILNVTAINPSGRGFATVHPCGTLPKASSLNAAESGVVVGNEVIAKLSNEGKVCIYSSATTHITADVVGFVPAGAQTVSLTPIRLLDTRPGETTIDGLGEGGGHVAQGSITTVSIAGRPGIPATGASAVVINVTAINPLGRGFVTVYPCGEVPLASSLNYSSPGAVVGNEVIANLSSEGKVCLFSSESTQLTVDAVGFVSS